ncbi:MAG: hypothetical protein IJW45_00740 [Oscillospiraceae bacterium]|nr:hypothetical protein [Oscillospiraceae bacterium]
MEKLVFDSGIREFEINGGGVLRFNPSDPNVYARLVDAVGKIQAVEEALVAEAQKAEGDGGAALRLLEAADRKIKDILGWVFGRENDFDQIFGGVNVMGVGGNGERVITNFLAALHPIVEAGAQLCAQQQVDAAVAEAKVDRAQRGKA